MAIKRYVFSGDRHIVENDECVDLIETIGEWIVAFIGTWALALDGTKSTAADKFQIGRAKVTDEFHRVIGKGFITPICDRRLG